MIFYNIKQINRQIDGLQKKIEILFQNIIMNKKEKLFSMSHAYQKGSTRNKIYFRIEIMTHFVTFVTHFGCAGI